MISESLRSAQLKPHRHVFFALNGVLAMIVAIAAWVNIHSAVQLTALIGVVWLAVLLVAPRLIGVGWLQRWQVPLGQLLQMRKYLGLWSAAWLSAHATLAFLIYFGNFEQFFTSIQSRPTLILKMAGLGIMLLLVLMSNTWSMTHIPGWKRIQMMVWMVPGMALPSSWLAAETFLGQTPLLLIAPVAFIACIVAGFTTRFFTKRTSTDWWRLGFLSFGILIALFVLQI